MNIYQDVPERLEGHPLLQKMWGRMHRENKNLVLAIVGETGSGKSYSALSLAEMLDPTFSVDNIAWNLDEFVEAVNEDRPRGAVDVIEEGSVQLNAKTWWEREQQLVQQVLDTWRHQNRCAILTLPTFGQLQKDSRERCHGLLQTRGIDYRQEITALRYRYIQVNSDSGKVYKKYHEFERPQGRDIKVTWLGLGKPSEPLRAAYEERKEEFTRELNERVLEELQDDGEAEAERSPLDVVEAINEDGGIEAYAKTAHNGIEYVDADLIEVDYGISARKAEKVKKLLQREAEEA